MQTAIKENTVTIILLTNGVYQDQFFFLLVYLNMYVVCMDLNMYVFCMFI